jgi:endonuclease/exonuclease/phosphatase family metal-dependent hydrolase
MTTLRVVTFNIHKGFRLSKKQFVLSKLRGALETLNCDLVFLQEVQGEHRLRQATIVDWPEESQFTYLAEHGWPYFAYGKNAEYHQGHHGNAILSKYPFSHWENIKLTSNKKFSRSLLHGIIELTHQQPIHVICFHLGLREVERKRQSKILCERIHDLVPKDAALIVAGDSNDIRGVLANYFQDETIHEAHLETNGKHAKTFPAWFPCLPLDRIYYRGLMPIVAKSLDEPPWNKLSDHLALYSEFEIKG